MTSILGIMESKTEIVVAEDIINMLGVLDDAEEVIEGSMSIILHQTATQARNQDEMLQKGQEVLNSIREIRKEWDTSQEDEAPPTPTGQSTSEKIAAIRASAGGCSLEHIRTKPWDKAPTVDTSRR